MIDVNVESEKMKLVVIVTISSAQERNTNEKNVFDNAFKLEYELEYEFDCDVLSSPTIDTIHTTGVTSAPAFNFCAIRVASREFDVLGFDLGAASSPTTIAATQGIKNQNEMLHESGSLCGDVHTQTQHPTAPGIDTINSTATMVVYLIIILMELDIHVVCLYFLLSFVFFQCYFNV